MSSLDDAHVNDVSWQPLCSLAAFLPTVLSPYQLNWSVL